MPGKSFLDDTLKAEKSINVDSKESVAPAELLQRDATGELLTSFLDTQAVDSMAEVSSYVYA